jgi:hypothetical protein
VRNGKDGDRGEIADGFYKVEGGELVLTDVLQRHIASRALRERQKPADLARQLLRERATESDFWRRIEYLKASVA